MTVESPAYDFTEPFPGDSEMARLMRAHDWSATCVGSPSTWPANLRTAVSICLTSQFPMNVMWGPDLTLLYNDAYTSFLGPKRHPAALGRSGREVWGDLWPQIGSMVERVMTSGESSWSEDTLMFLDRLVSRGEAYVTLS